MAQVRLGLIGDNIRASRAPALHRLCGRLAGLDIRYDLFIPPSLGMSFDETFDKLRSDGLAGTNITLPYKEQAIAMVQIDDPAISRIGAINTVRFGPNDPQGFNTDYSGFISAYRNAFGDMPPGRVVMIGAGGVGKAVAFGLAALQASEICIVDTDAHKAASLVRSLELPANGRMRVRVGGLDDLGTADGVINCTPLGMVGYPGSPVPDGAFPNNGWAFDAVYTPMDTPFRAQALAAGAQFLSGYELFFYQGVHAFKIFTGAEVEDLAALRAMLQAEAEGALK